MNKAQKSWGLKSLLGRAKQMQQASKATAKGRGGASNSDLREGGGIGDRRRRTRIGRGSR